MTKETPIYNNLFLENVRIKYPTIFKKTQIKGYLDKAPKYRAKFIIDTSEQVKEVINSINHILSPHNKRFEGLTGINKMPFFKAIVDNENYYDSEWLLNSSTEQKVQITSPCASYDYEEDTGLIIDLCRVNAVVTLKAYVSEKAGLVVSCYLDAVQYISEPNPEDLKRLGRPEKPRFEFKPINFSNAITNNSTKAITKNTLDDEIPF